MSLPHILAGSFDLALAAFHLAFWHLLGWPRSLAAAGRINAAVTQVLNVMLTYVFATFGLTLVIYATTGRTIDPIVPAIAAGFWIIRAAIQPIMFPRAAPWSLALTAVFLAGALLHGWAALS